MKTRSIAGKIGIGIYEKNIPDLKTGRHSRNHAIAIAESELPEVQIKHLSSPRMTAYRAFQIFRNHPGSRSIELLHLHRVCRVLYHSQAHGVEAVVYHNHPVEGCSLNVFSFRMGFR